MLDVQLVVLAKAPVAGRVKTRLCPPLTPGQAAEVAGAAIADTLAVVGEVPVRRRVVVLDGLPPDGLIPSGFDVLPQRGRGLDERLAAACADVFLACSLPILLIGMDTPHVTPSLLEAPARLLAAGKTVLGPAYDGGWWAIGLTSPDAGIFLGVPMSSDTTGGEQEQRMRDRGLAPVLLPVLRDIDHVTDLRAVVADLPKSSRLAAVVRAVDAHVPALLSGA